MAKKPNLIERAIKRIDHFQQAHAPLAFLYAVSKKYSDDHGGYQSALITYYGFLSLLPLLIVFTALTQLFLHGDPGLQQQVAESVNRYFPSIGEQLQAGINSPNKTGLALIVSLIVTLFGARGGASALQYTLSTLWHIPVTKHPPFPKNIIRSFGIIFLGGGGLVVSALLSGLLSLLGREAPVRVLAALVSTLLLWGTFIIVFKLAIAGNKPLKHIALSAGIAAVGLQLLQILGGIVLAHELQGLQSAYGTFALVLGILFWINLQAQLILYAVEVDVVKERKLYPRSLQEPLTTEDKRTYKAQAQADQQHSSEAIDVNFKDRH